MSQQELYEIASKRIDRRNRRWTLWAFNLGVMILAVAGIIFAGDSVYSDYATGFMMLWAAVFVTHTIVLGMTESRDGDIEKEIAKLQDYAYEKPKRLELSDDGELLDYSEWQEEDAKHSRA
jgi:hypothetical protein